MPRPEARCRGAASSVPAGPKIPPGGRGGAGGPGRRARVRGWAHYTPHPALAGTRMS